jgi:hypothetical protein
MTTQIISEQRKPFWKVTTVEQLMNLLEGADPKAVIFLPYDGDSYSLDIEVIPGEYAEGQYLNGQPYSDQFYPAGESHRPWPATGKAILLAARDRG